MLISFFKTKNSECYSNEKKIIGILLIVYVFTQNNENYIRTRGHEFQNSHSRKKHSSPSSFVRLTPKHISRAFLIIHINAI